MVLELLDQKTPDSIQQQLSTLYCSWEEALEGKGKSASVDMGISHEHRKTHTKFNLSKLSSGTSLGMFRCLVFKTRTKATSHEIQTR